MKHNNLVAGIKELIGEHLELMSEEGETYEALEELIDQGEYLKAKHTGSDELTDYFNEVTGVARVLLANYDAHRLYPDSVIGIKTIGPSSEGC